MAAGMTNVPPPKVGFIESLRRIPWSGEQRWMDGAGKRIYTWDRLHGEFEVFDRQGFHLGSADPASGKLMNGPVKGRKIDV
jgi:hypothetical protein